MELIKIALQRGDEELFRLSLAHFLQTKGDVHVREDILLDLAFDRGHPAMLQTLLSCGQYGDDYFLAEKHGNNLLRDVTLVLQHPSLLLFLIEQFPNATVRDLRFNDGVLWAISSRLKENKQQDKLEKEKIEDEEVLLAIIDRLLDLDTGLFPPDLVDDLLLSA